jgi:hypothetical protein
MKFRSSGIDTSLERACCQCGPIDHHTSLPQRGQTKRRRLPETALLLQFKYRNAVISSAQQAEFSAQFLA